MEGMDIYTLISSILTLICGGGWFINWRAKKRKESAEARQTELNATITEQDMYQEMLKDVEADVVNISDLSHVLSHFKNQG